MIWINQLDPKVLEAIHERGYTDAEISGMSANEAFNEWCCWHGFLGWSDTIRRVLDNIRDAYEEPR